MTAPGAATRHPVAITKKRNQMEQITIAAQTFNVPLRYEEGHELSAGEASALNQTYHENIRNNLAKKAKEGTLTQADVDAYASEYQFGADAKLVFGCISIHVSLGQRPFLGFFGEVVADILVVGLIEGRSLAGGKLVAFLVTERDVKGLS